MRWLVSSGDKVKVAPNLSIEPERVHEAIQNILEALERIEMYDYISPDDLSTIPELSLLGEFSDMRLFTLDQFENVLRRIPLQALLDVFTVMGELDVIRGYLVRLADLFESSMRTVEEVELIQPVMVKIIKPDGSEEEHELDLSWWLGGE